MSPVILPPPVEINEVQTQAFGVAVAKALSSVTLDDLRQIYLFHDRAVVVSYSSNYEPFIGFTMSYNDPDYRLYIHKETYVLTRIAEALESQGRDIPGGRVFIESRYAYIKDMGFHHCVILHLDWKGYDPYQVIKLAYDWIINIRSSE